MLDAVKEFLAKNAKVVITLVLAGVGGVTLGYNKGCNVSFAPEVSVTAPDAGAEAP